MYFVYNQGPGCTIPRGHPPVECVVDARKHLGVVDVAVPGQFKAGKSSLLNSLPGKNLLPVDGLPVTAVITRIGFGTSDKMTVHRVTGKGEELPVDRIAEFGTERQNPGNEKQVSLVELQVSPPGYRSGAGRAFNVGALHPASLLKQERCPFSCSPRSR